MVANMKVNGRMTYVKVGVSRDIQMVTLTMVGLRWVRLMVKESTLGLMERSTMANGIKD